MCGGTTGRRAEGQPCGGLSPCVRGNPVSPSGAPKAWGSIPACAGEPHPADDEAVGRTVYPRVCGGTETGLHVDMGHKGLSPRVRGNLSLWASSGRCWGSIPACAGEPITAATEAASVRVYPRVCGGTECPRATGRYARGLSPRVRGNPGYGRGEACGRGSIPACAGEPHADEPGRGLCGVYPRVCGGTSLRRPVHPHRRGLSPRVRGNPKKPLLVNEAQGSIPACAGEPRPFRHLAVGKGVYPRVCGGTPLRFTRRFLPQGLSPCVRGNLHSLPEDAIKVGSIPACAGEPRRWSRGSAPGTVYPRVCGGTVVGDVLVGLPYGLSPRVRGNPGALRHLRPQAGSIPACAGEPKQCAPPA